MINSRNLTSYLVLKAISDEPLCGYDIRRKIKSMSDNELDVSAGTIYTNLGILRTNGYLKDLDRPLPNNRIVRIVKIEDKGLDYIYHTELVYKKIMRSMND